MAANMASADAGLAAAMEQSTIADTTLVLVTPSVVCVSDANGSDAWRVPGRPADGTAEGQATRDWNSVFFFAIPQKPCHMGRKNSAFRYSRPQILCFLVLPKKRGIAGIALSTEFAHFRATITS